MDEYFIVSVPVPRHPSLKANLYKLFCSKTKEYAETIGKEVAEGPTVYLPDNFYGPVELWPLVVEAENVVSG